MRLSIKVPWDISLSTSPSHKLQIPYIGVIIYIIFIYLYIYAPCQAAIAIQQIVMYRHKTLQLPSLLPYNRLSSWRWASYRDREESASERKINAMDLIKYMSK